MIRQPVRTASKPLKSREPRRVFPALEAALLFLRATKKADPRKTQADLRFGPAVD